MDYFLSEEQKTIVEIAKKITEERIIPARAELDEKQEFPHAIIEEIGKSDLFGLFIPEEYGGFGGNIMDVCLAVEEFSRGCIGVSTTYAASGLGILPIIIAGSDEQKKKYLPLFAQGKLLCAFGLTEPDAGSDASNINTTAKKDGDHYIINGTKQWITNGGEADFYTIFAMTDRSRGSRGLSALIIEKGASGFSYGKKENKLGIRASSTRELIFDNCKIPAENMISREGMGFVVALRTLDRARPVVGAQAVGLAQGAMEEAIKFSKVRHQFGTAISSFQAIQHMLADMAIGIEAARSLVYATARYIDSGGKDYSGASAIAKVFPTDMAMRVAVDALQVLGGSGYMKEYPVEKMMRDAKILQIYEGTNQIQRSIIANELLKKY
ncbi:MAG: acyl-CoA dehydrogenase family protein [Actinobacteria bacterium]|nr:acyl-CoA dehydrogenase family protein [Actinomycetota bacterium]